MDSIIFDLDGTLWDSRETVLIAWNKIILEHPKLHKQLTKEDFKKTMGLQVKEIGKILFPELDEEEQENIIKACCDLECDFLTKHGGNLYPDVEKVIKELSQKYKLYIVSNCQHGYIESFFNYHNLEHYFIDYENPGRTGLSKGENIQLVLNRNGLSSPVYVGDTIGDQKAAKFAGIPFVYAKYGFGNVESYDWEIEKFSEITEIF